MFAIRDGKWKLVLGNGSGGRENPRGKPFAKPYQLFDMSKDIAESTNVAEQHPEVVQRLEKACTRIRGRGSSRRLSQKGARGFGPVEGNMPVERKFAQAQIVQLGTAVELFAIEIGTYPKSLRELIDGPSDGKLAEKFVGLLALSYPLPAR